MMRRRKLRRCGLCEASNGPQENHESSLKPGLHFSKAGIQIMSSSLRILIADDSSVTRRIVSEAFSREADMDVVGAAQDGEEAIAFFKAQEPDLVLLDVEMPGMNGIETLKAIRRLNGDVPIIMFCPMFAHTGEAKREALAAGATDYASKPIAVGHADRAMAFLKEEVVSKVRMLGNRYKTEVRNPTKSTL